MIVLASASPRRRELLRAAGLRFEVAPTHVDESLPPGVDPLEAARRLALRKARSAAAAQGAPPGWYVGADTVVAAPAPSGGEECLGKPADAAQARAMLGRLSGTRHRVITGVAVLRHDRGEGPGELVEAETTWVTMRPISAAEIAAYADSGEWRDKAGGYAIQETADRFVTELEGGGFDNVVGLPVPLTLRLLAALGAPLPGLHPS